MVELRGAIVHLLDGSKLQLWLDAELDYTRNDYVHAWRNVCDPETGLDGPEAISSIGIFTHAITFISWSGTTFAIDKYEFLS